MKVVAPAKACIEVDGLSGRRYKARDGIYEMSERDGRALIKAGGFAPSLGSPRTGGFRCPCGFRPLFRICSRCQRELTEEDRDGCKQEAV